jgi:hypothetical protein
MSEMNQDNTLQFLECKKLISEIVSIWDSFYIAAIVKSKRKNFNKDDFSDIYDKILHLHNLEIEFFDTLYDMYEHYKLIDRRL